MGATEAHTGELAGGVARLGTETAFAVLARARAMERAGRDVIHLEIGEPDFATPAHISEAAFDGAAGRRDPLLPVGRHPGAARGGRRVAGAHARRADRPGTGRSSPPAPSRFSSSPCWRPASRATRSSTPTPASRSTSRRSASPARRRCRCRCARSATSASTRRARGAARARAHEARHPQLAAEPDRRRARPRDARGGGAAHRADATPGCSPTRSTRGCSTTASSPRSQPSRGCSSAPIVLDGFSKTYAMTGWRCGYAAVPDALVDPLDALLRQLDVLRAAVRPARRRRGARPGRRTPSIAMVAEFRRPPRPRRRRPQRAARRLLPDRRAGRSTSSRTWPTRS